MVGRGQRALSEETVLLIDRTLTELFAEQATRTPDRVAVVAGRTRLTYRELYRAATRLAAVLIERGAGPERVVALLVNRSVDTVTAILGVLQSGAAYLPIDPATPAERIAFMAADTDPVAVVLGAGATPPPALRARALVDINARPPVGVADQPAVRRWNVAHTAYVIYTSGSTGMPKGVQVSHRNVTALFATVLPKFEFTGDDVWTLFHSYAFDFSVWEIWGALLTGGRIVVVPKETSWSPSDFVELLAAENVTVLSQTPSSFYRVLEADLARRAGGGGALPLRTVVFGGEALDVSRLRTWHARYPDNAPRLVNMYGLTEATVHVSHLNLDRPHLGGHTSRPVGDVLPGFRALLLDDGLEPVVGGSVGELYLAGPQLARGYLGRPALTASRFVADPAGSGGRVYRTGDVFSHAIGGGFDFAGRVDRQVKVRGFRIEPGEIESALAAHHAVRDVAVVAREDESNAAQLVAYVVPPEGTDAEGTDIDVAALRRHLARTLPDHMVPKHFVTLPALPMTANNKLDRAALPAPLPRHGTAPDSVERRMILLRRRLASGHDEGAPS
jgi:amino acid adenylation domain-containing protein